MNVHTITKNELNELKKRLESAQEILRTIGGFADDNGAIVYEGFHVEPRDTIEQEMALKKSVLCTTRFVSKIV